MGSLRRRLRATLIAFLGLGAVGYLAVLLLDAGSRTAVVVAAVGGLVSALLAASACGLAARRCGGRLRLFWGGLAAFAATWGAGQAATCWYQVLRNDAAPMPGLPDVGYLLSVPIAIVALLYHPHAPGLGSGRVRLLTEGVLVGTALLALSWRLGLNDVAHGLAGTALTQAVMLAYPVMDVLLLTVLVLLLAGTTRASFGPLLPVGAALCFGAVGHLSYRVLDVSGQWVSGSSIEAAWGWGFLLLGAGALTQQPDAMAARRDRVPGTRLGALPYAPVVLAITVAVVDRARGNVQGRANALLMLVLVVAIMVRQLSALRENGRLNRDLESTVVLRTAELRRLAESDPLTGLPNRTRLFDRIAAALVAGPTSVALLDLDGFKAVNDSLGHAAGDELLVGVARRLETATLPGWTVARLGGDEFAVVLAGVGTERSASAAGAALLRSLDEPVQVAGRSIEVAASLGVVVAIEGDTAQDLMRNADVAMYAAKEAAKDSSREALPTRRGTARVFVPSMRERLLQRVSMEADLRRALASGEVVPHYQPVVELPGGGVRGVEALARWTRQDGNYVPPAVFIPLAEECGLIQALGRSILLAACIDAGRWHRAAAAGRLAEAPTLSVNVSAVQLASESLVDDVREALAAGGFPADQLVLEITETAVVRDVATAATRLAELRQLGVRIALDDFGTGYSALGALQSLPVDIIKIDHAFVRDVHLGVREAAVVTAVIALANSLDLTVIAEGVELPEQARRLRALGCRMAQGFLYSPAVPADELVGLLAEATPTTPYAVPPARQKCAPKSIRKAV